MSTLTIDAENNITAYGSAEEATRIGDSTSTSFDSHPALIKVSGEWPMSRFVETWNSIPGQTSVKKFQDGKDLSAHFVWSIKRELARQMPTIVHADS